MVWNTTLYYAIRWEKTHAAYRRVPTLSKQTFFLKTPKFTANLHFKRFSAGTSVQTSNI